VELHGDLLTIRGEKREENRAEEKDEGGRVVYLRTERVMKRWITLVNGHQRLNTKSSLTPK